MTISQVANATRTIGSSSAVQYVSGGGTLTYPCENYSTLTFSSLGGTAGNVQYKRNIDSSYIKITKIPTIVDLSNSITVNIYCSSSASGSASDEVSNTRTTTYTFN